MRAEQPAVALQKLRELDDAHAAACEAFGADSRQATRLRPNVVAYTIAALAHAKQADLAGAVATLQTMKAKKVSPNARTCAALLEACLEAKQPEAGEALVREMSSSRQAEPRLFLYESLYEKKTHTHLSTPKKRERDLSRRERERERERIMQARGGCARGRGD